MCLFVLRAGNVRAGADARRQTFGDELGEARAFEGEGVVKGTGGVLGD